MGQWGIPAGNYSGIAPLGEGRFALISDKQQADGWLEVSISFDAMGDIARMDYVGAHLAPTGGKARDAEGIVAVRQQQTAHSALTDNGRVSLFVSAESDQEVLELDLDGRPTGRRLDVPQWCAAESIYGNYGFEALAHDAEDGTFWTTTEQGLRSDVDAPSSPSHSVPTLLRLVSFAPSLQPGPAYAYRTEAPGAKQPTRLYAFGVPELTVLPDHSLLVLEREVVVRPRFDGSYVRHRIFRVDPSTAKPCSPHTPLKQLPSDAFLAKTLVGEFTTHLDLFGRKDFANYEGMCLGPTLPDGRQTLLLVADSQNRMGNSLFSLKDYIRVAILNP